MLRPASLDAYLHAPWGRFVLGPTFAAWSLNAELSGIALWGRPSEPHVAAMAAALEAEVRADARPHASLVDLRHVHGIDTGAFAYLQRYVGSRREALAKTILKQALVRPDGLVGAGVAGFYALLPPGHPVRVFVDVESALTWLGGSAHVGFLGELDRITARANARLVPRLHAHLEGNLSSSLADAARALGISSRKLQRRLAEERTSFQKERDAARLRAAQELLLGSDFDLKRVALEVGWTWPQQFSSVFHKRFGETPSAWRERFRSGRCFEPPGSSDRRAYSLADSVT